MLALVVGGGNGRKTEQQQHGRKRGYEKKADVL
jgi:hypothetical protein